MDSPSVLSYVKCRYYHVSYLLFRVVGRIKETLYAAHTGNQREGAFEIKRHPMAVPLAA